MYIGQHNLKPVKILDGVQKSILITGPPGSGKSSRMQQIEAELVKTGGTAIVIDVTPAHTKNRILNKISAEYEARVNRIDAVREGLRIEFLSPFMDKDGNAESDFRVINSVVTALSNPRNGFRQIGVLRDVVTEAVGFKSLFRAASDMDLIKGMLEKRMEYGESTVEGLYMQLWAVFHSGIFRPSSRSLQKNMINIIDFSGVEISTAVICAEILLATLWRMAYFAGFDKRFGTVLIVIDECQLFPLRLDSSIGVMITEGRKFGVNLALGTQSMRALNEEKRALLGMAATRLFFQPEKSDQTLIISKLQQDVGDRAKRFRVGDLQVGEAIAMGPLECGGYPINGAILTS